MRSKILKRIGVAAGMPALLTVATLASANNDWEVIASDDFSSNRFSSGFGWADSAWNSADTGKNLPKAHYGRVTFARHKPFMARSLTLPTGAPVRLSFDYQWGKSRAKDYTFEAIVTDANGQPTTIATIESEFVRPYQHFEADLSEFAGQTITLAFSYLNNDSTKLDFDNVVVSMGPSQNTGNDGVPDDSAPEPEDEDFGGGSDVSDGSSDAGESGEETGEGSVEGSVSDLDDSEAMQKALALWRDNNPDKHPKGSCAGCHGADFFDLARIGTTAEDTIRRAIIDGATSDQAEALVAAIEQVRGDYNLSTTDARSFRPFQPGGAVLLPELTGDRNEVRVRRDVAFGESLKQYLPTWFGPRVDSLRMAEQAKEEMLDLARGTNYAGYNPALVQLRDLPVGMEYPLWSADLHHGVEEGTFNDWISDLAFEPKSGYESEWYDLQDTYLSDPSDYNFWKMYVGSFNLLEMRNAPGCVKQLGSLDTGTQKWCQNQVYFFREKFTNALLGQHMLRVDSLGRAGDFRQGANAFSYLDYRPEYDFLITDRKKGDLTAAQHLWGVGRSARTSFSSHGRNGEFVKGLEDVSHQSFVIDSVDKNRPGFREHYDLRSIWTWIGFTHDPSMNRLGVGSTRTGEYAVASYRQQNLHIHADFQGHMQLLVQGFLEESNRRKLTSTSTSLTQSDTLFHMHYQHYVEDILRWKEDGRWEDTQPLPPALKDEQEALWSQLTTNGYRIIMYLYQDRMIDTGTSAGKIAENTIGRHLQHYQPEHGAADKALLNSVVQQHRALGGTTKN